MNKKKLAIRIIAYLMTLVTLLEPVAASAAELDEVYITEEIGEDSSQVISEDPYGTGEEMVEEDGYPTDIGSAVRQLNAMLSERNIMAVLYLCDTYPLRSAPVVDSSVIYDLGSGTSLLLKGVIYNGSDYWFYVSAATSLGELYGYIPKDRFICIDEDYLAWDEAATRLAFGDAISADAASVTGKALESVYYFPDSYRDSLLKVLNAHPNWIFVPQKIGMTLDQAVSAQMADRNKNWVYSTVNDAFKGSKINSNWYYASKEGLMYYMNPANFVSSVKSIFMFEQLTYNESYHSPEGIQSVLASTFMKGAVPGEDMTYAEAFYSIGRKLKVSPYHLASRVCQEQGGGTSPLISGTYAGYEGYYNYFNIKASGSSNREIYVNGLSFAKDQGWDTRYKALLGGAEFDSKNYILAGQDTLYLEKYNVLRKDASHQYMQNASAPLTESSKVYSMYEKTGALNNAFVFKIPVFEGETTSPAPKLKPEVNITSSQRPNIFYSNQSDLAAAKFTIAASEKIKSIGISEESKEKYEQEGIPYFDVYDYDRDLGVITLMPRGLNDKNIAKLSKKVTLEIGFAEYGSMTYNLSVSVQNSAVRIKADSAVLYGSVNKTVTMIFADELPEDITVTCTDPAAEVSIDQANMSVELNVSDSFRTGTKRLVFESSLWRLPVTANLPVKRVKAPSMKLSVSKVKLNSALSLQANGATYISAHLSGSVTDCLLDGIKPANDAAAKLIDEGYLITDVLDNKIALGLDTEKRGEIKAGNYSFIASGHFEDRFGNEIALKDAKLTVTIVDKDPSKLFSMKAKGSLSISSPDEKYVIYTPKFNELGSATRVINSYISGEYADIFDVQAYAEGSELPDGSTVKDKTGVIRLYVMNGELADYSKRYRLTIVSVLDNGLEVTKSVTVKPVR